MAATIKLVTYAGQTVTPKDDAIIYDSAVAQNGVFYGCDVTASGNTLYIAGGYGMIKGRFFEIENSSIPVTLASGDTLLGRLYIHLDLSNSEAPIQLLTETGSSLSTLEHDDDANYTDGVWDVEMATFNVTTSAITSLVEKFDVIRDRAYLQSQIDTLNSNIGKTRFTFSSSVNGAQGALGYGYKDNATKTVRVYFTARFNSNVGPNVSMFSIPSEYRPSSNNGAVCIVTTDANASVAGHAVIGSDGTITQGLTSNCRGITGFAEYDI